MINATKQRDQWTMLFVQPCEEQTSVTSLGEASAFSAKSVPAALHEHCHILRR